MREARGATFSASEQQVNTSQRQRWTASSGTVMDVGKVAALRLASAGFSITLANNFERVLLAEGYLLGRRIRLEPNPLGRTFTQADKSSNEHQLATLALKNTKLTATTLSSGQEEKLISA